MATELLINARSYETRVALIENNILAEFHIERPRRHSLAGNIYKGQVVRVLPGHAGGLRRDRPGAGRLPVCKRRN